MLVILSALLLILSFPNFNLSFIAWVALVPLLFALEGKAPRDAFRLSYLFGTIFFLGTIYWLIHVTLPGMIAVALFLALYFGLFGFLLSKIFRTADYKFIFLAPALWVAMEWLRSHLLGGFGWVLLAHSQSNALLVTQISDITGAYGVSFLVMLVNSAIFVTLKDLRSRTVRTIPPLAAAVLVLYVSVTYGTLRLKNIFVGEKLKISVVQGNIPQNEKWDPNLKGMILDRYERLTKEAAKDRPDLIVWPESSVPGFLETERDLSDRMKDIAILSDAHMLVGVPREEDSYKKIYNSAVLFSGEGRVVDHYDKIHLVPFGEYVPFKSMLSFVEKFAKSQIGDFHSGEKYSVFKFFIERRSTGEGAAWKLLKKAKFSCLICFEDIFPDLTRQFVRNGAVFLVNITNDAWFGNTSAPYQHMQCSVFRAIENRVNVIRAANTGISCFIDQKGHVAKLTSPDNKAIFVEGFKTSEITLTPTRTFYTLYGDIFAYICMLYVLLSIALSGYPHKFLSKLR